MQTHIEVKALKAAIHCAAKKDIRYYLQSVLIEFEAGAPFCRVVSTDGHVLFAGLSRCAPVSETVNLLIPIETAQLVLKTLQKKQEIIAITQVDGVYKIHGVYEIGFKPVDGRFPDWRRVVPESVNNEPATFGVQLLEKVDSALRAFAGVGPSASGIYSMAHNGEAATSVLTLNEDNNCFCLIMPLRKCTKSTYSRQWWITKNLSEGV